MNDLAIRTIAAHAGSRAAKDVGRNDPFVTRLRHFIELSPSDLRGLRDVRRVHGPLTSVPYSLAENGRHAARGRHDDRSRFLS